MKSRKTCEIKISLRECEAGSHLSLLDNTAVSSGKNARITPTVADESPTNIAPTQHCNFGTSSPKKCRQTAL